MHNTYTYTSRWTGNRARKNNVFFCLMLFSLQRNAHLYEPNLVKFSRENLAKFAFREGFSHFSLDSFDRRSLLFFQTKRFSVVFFAGAEHVDSHIAIASTTHTREDLCSLNPTPAVRVYTVSTTPEISAA